jgi:hypothetical protein
LTGVDKEENIMAIFNLYNDLSNSISLCQQVGRERRVQVDVSGLERQASEAWEEAAQEAKSFPVWKFDEADVCGLVEGMGAKVCVHAACGCKEVHDELPYMWKFISVTKCNGKFIVHVAVDYKCSACAMAEMRSRMASCFNTMEWAHGLSAYSRTHSVSEAVERLHKTISHPEWEICVTESDVQVGPFGLFLKGSVMGLFDGDVWSSVNEEGQRISDQACEYNFVGDSIEKYLNAKSDEYHQYFEGFLSQYECTGVWMDRKAASKYEDLSAAMRAEARRLGVPFTLV